MAGFFKKHTLPFSIIVHALLLASMIVVWHPSRSPKIKKPSEYVPSYAYEEPPSPPPAYSEAKQTASDAKQASKDTPAKVEPLKKNEIAEKIEKPTQATQATQLARASSTSSNTSAKVNDAIHLVGDKKSVPKPLIRMLGKALGKTLKYPKIALDFRLRGTAYVSFVLHPDGSITNVEVVQSSKAGVLDGEAARAVKAMSPMANISQYVDKPKEMVVGIIFN